MKRDGRPGRAWTKKPVPVHQAPRLETLDACREAWAVGNPEALRSGIALCVHAGGLPAWLGDALMQLLKLHPVQQRFWKPYLQDLIDFDRFGAVRAARRRGLTWDEAYKAAEQELALQPSFGGHHVMKKSYNLVAHRARTAPARYALRPPKE